MTEFLVLVLATYAISRTITREDGPFAIFSRLRGLAIGPPPEPTEHATDEQWEAYNATFNDYERFAEQRKRTFIGTLEGVLGCPYCLSWYVALGVVASSVAVGGIYWYSLLLWPAVVGGVYVLLVIEDRE